ncbi:hypothetical protein QTP86_034236 [Hemibagrus guttatus]|nr:hypothetical protein QTP86_034236 [Hemibagrus guttatus]
MPQPGLPNPGLLDVAAAPESSQVMVELNGCSVPALLDSRSTISLVRPSVLPKTARLAGTIPILCIHGNVQSVPSAQVLIWGPAGKWPIIADVIQNLLVPMLLGYDWPGFSTTMKASTQSAGRGPSLMLGLPQVSADSPQKPAPASLIPLPFISVPFKHVSMDLFGPLPKSERGHEYILVMMD